MAPPRGGHHAGMAPRPPRRGGVPIAERGPGWSYRPDEAAGSTHQPGIATVRLDRLVLAAFDVHGDAAGVLAAWTRAGSELMSPTLTLTVGLGAGVCPRAVRPVALRDLPPFPGDALDARRCGGDLAVQICARDPAHAAEALGRLETAAAGAISPRWRECGAIERGPRDSPAGTPRDPLGFRDGTHNLRRGRDLDRHVWIDRGDRTAMTGGTYLVVRNIEIDVHAWNALALPEQEQRIGRHRDSGAPLGGRREFDPAPLDAFPPESHVRLASPRTGPSPPMLRRSYNTGDGLLFLAFMRDPARQFVPVQRRLAERDPLGAFTRHTGSAVFAIPPAAPPGGFLGAGLLAGR